MHRYRTHTCGALSLAEDGAAVRLSGWCHRIRDHGGLLFIDLRDHYGLTQCVVDPDSPAFAEAEKLRSEFVMRVDGRVRKRPPGTENPEMPTGLVEVYVREIEVLGPAGDLPLPVFGDQPYPEDTRLRYRFLDLRREKLHQNIMLRGQIIDSLAQTDEGAGVLRVPDADPHRLEPRRRARLPRARRACIRASSTRCRRRRSSSSSSPWSPASTAISRSRPAFATRTRAPTDPRRVLPARHRDELRHPGGRVRGGRAGAARACSRNSARGRPVTPKFPRIPYAEAMLKYGIDKPDLRNPIVIADVTEVFRATT